MEQRPERRQAIRLRGTHWRKLMGAYVSPALSRRACRCALGCPESKAAATTACVRTIAPSEAWKRGKKINK